MSKFERIICKSGILAIVGLMTVLSFSSCDNDDDATTTTDDTAILGTWRMIGEDYHPAIATFKSNGEYEWEWGGITGLKDNGTYTYKNGVITMTIKERWECETGWKDHQITHGEWRKVTDIDPEDPTTRVCTVYTVQESFLIWNFGGDYFYMADSEYGYTEYNAVIFMLNDKFQEPNIKIDENLVKGEWISTDSEGKLDGRIIIEGNNYTSYSAFPFSMQDEGGEWIQVLVSTKLTGTYRFDRGFFIVTLSKYERSYEDLGYNMETQRYEYDYSTVDPNTLEAEEWIVSQEQEDILKVMVYVYNNRLFFQQEYDREATVYKKK